MKVSYAAITQSNLYFFHWHYYARIYRPIHCFACRPIRDMLVDYHSSVCVQNISVADLQRILMTNL